MDYLTYDEFCNIKKGDILRLELQDTAIVAVAEENARYNPDSDEPSWEVQTDNGVIDIDNDVAKLGHSDLLMEDPISNIGSMGRDKLHELLGQAEREYETLKNTPCMSQRIIDEVEHIKIEVDCALFELESEYENEMGEY